MENIVKNELKTDWDEAFDKAEAEQSPTLSETMRVSNQPFPELIEDYLEANLDLNEKEVAFLKVSMEMKRQNQESRNEDMVAVDDLREEIVSATAPEEKEQNYNEELDKKVDALREGMKILNIDPETMISLDSENSDMWKKKYQFTDKRASKLGIMGLFGFGKSRHLIEFYETLGGIALENGIDMTEPKSVSEILSALDQKAG